MFINLTHIIKGYELHLKNYSISYGTTVNSCTVSMVLVLLRVDAILGNGCSLREVKCLQGCSRTLLLGIYCLRFDKIVSFIGMVVITAHLGYGSSSSNTAKVCKFYFSILLLFRLDFTKSINVDLLRCLDMGSFFQIIIFCRQT